MSTKRLDLPSPQQTREMAAQAIVEENARLRNKVIIEIQNCAAAGKENAVVYFSIPKPVREELVAAGYQVESFSDEYTCGYVISWPSQEEIEKRKKWWRLFNGFA